MFRIYRYSISKVCGHVKRELKFAEIKLICLTAEIRALAFQEVRNILKLRNVVGTVTTVVNEQWEDMVELPAGVSLVQLCQFGEYCTPEQTQQVVTGFSGGGVKGFSRKKEGNVSFNDALNTFYLQFMAYNRTYYKRPFK